MSPAQNTKIELLTETIEALVLATVIATTSTNDNQRQANHENIVDARKVLRKAIVEVLTPTLRVMDSGALAA